MATRRFGKEPYKAKKCLFHALRYIVFAIQILKHGNPSFLLSFRFSSSTILILLLLVIYYCCIYLIRSGRIIDYTQANHYLGEIMQFKPNNDSIKKEDEWTQLKKFFSPIFKVSTPFPLSLILYYNNNPLFFICFSS